MNTPPVVLSFCSLFSSHAVLFCHVHLDLWTVFSSHRCHTFTHLYRLTLSAWRRRVLFWKRLHLTFLTSEKDEYCLAGWMVTVKNKVCPVTRIHYGALGYTWCTVCIMNTKAAASKWAMQVWVPTNICLWGAVCVLASCLNGSFSVENLYILFIVQFMHY